MTKVKGFDVAINSAARKDLFSMCSFIGTHGDNRLPIIIFDCARR